MCISFFSAYSLFFSKIMFFFDFFIISHDIHSYEVTKEKYQYKMFLSIFLSILLCEKSLKTECMIENECRITQNIATKVFYKLRRKNADQTRIEWWLGNEKKIRKKLRCECNKQSVNWNDYDGKSIKQKKERKLVTKWDWCYCFLLSPTVTSIKHIAVLMRSNQFLFNRGMHQTETEMK